MSSGNTYESNLSDSSSAETIANAGGDIHIYGTTRAEPRSAEARLRLFGVVPLVVADFVRRDSLTARLDGTELSVLTAVHGIGGVGKSQLAARYFNDNQHKYDFAAWIDMRERHGRAAYERIATDLQLSYKIGSDLVELVRNHIKSSSASWLIVFDNCEQPSHLDPLLPQSPNAKVIATSRYRHWQGYANSIAVDVFDESTAVTYLCERSLQPPGDDARQLATALGCLPLALSLAGSYCLQQALTFRSYVGSHLRTRVSDGLASSDPVHTDQAVRELWEQSLAAVSAVAPSARSVMELLCVLDWTDISRTWLADNYPEAELAPLFAYSLIELTPEHISVKHNLIADGVAGNIQDRGTIQRLLVQVFMGAITNTGADVATVEALAEPVRHLEHLTQAHPHLVTTDLLPVLNLAVWQLQDQGATKIEFAETVFQLARTLNGPDHIETLGSALRLAATYWTAGDYRGAVEIEAPALADCERTLGPDHHMTMMARNNFAVSCAKLGRNVEALEQAERALADRERVLGPDDIHTLNSKNNLANRLAAVGDHQQALRIDEQTLAQRVRTLGELHADALMSRNNLAVSYAVANRHQEALDLDQRTVVESVRVLGPGHPDTLTARHNLAIRRACVGDMRGAGQEAASVLQDREKILGADHPDTTMTQRLADQIRSVARADTPADDVLWERFAGFNRRLESLGLGDSI